MSGFPVSLQYKREEQLRGGTIEDWRYNLFSSFFFITTHYQVCPIFPYCVKRISSKIFKHFECMSLFCSGRKTLSKHFMFTRVRTSSFMGPVQLTASSSFKVSLKLHSSLLRTRYRTFACRRCNFLHSLKSYSLEFVTSLPVCMEPPGCYCDHARFHHTGSFVFLWYCSRDQHKHCSYSCPYMGLLPYCDEVTQYYPGTVYQLRL